MQGPKYEQQQGAKVMFTAIKGQDGDFV